MWWTGVNHDYEVQSRLKENLLNAYFTNGVNVGDSEELITIGVHTIPHESDDLEFAEFLRAFFASDAGKGEVAEELATAVSHGITGVPTYVINGQWSIPGAQDSETFERVLRRTAERMST
jgi:predicted DsbA family dithiol-disulfide isomerase